MHKAQHLFSTIIESYIQCGVEEGYFLSLAWREQGDLALAVGDRESALDHYELALKSGKVHLSERERAVLSLKKSRLKNL